MSKKKPEPIEIPTVYGPTSEVARKQCALNMKEDPAVKERVMDVLVRETGSVELAEAEMRRRYPEAFV